MSEHNPTVKTATATALDACRARLTEVEAKNERLRVLVDQAEIWMPGVSDTPWRREAHALGALSAE